jgi:hypothetical protein
VTLATHAPSQHKVGRVVGQRRRVPLLLSSIELLAHEPMPSVSWLWHEPSSHRKYPSGHVVCEGQNRMPSAQLPSGQRIWLSGQLSWVLAETPVASASTQR